MSERNYWVICDDGCKFPAMTKEQILAAITQAVNEGTIGDVDTGFITTIKTINGTPLKFFVGGQSEYETLTAAQKENLFAIITNDTTSESIGNAITELRNNYTDLIEGLNDGTVVVKNAETATALRLNAGFAEYDGGELESGLYLVLFVRYVDNTIESRYQTVLGVSAGTDGTSAILGGEYNTALYAAFVQAGKIIVKEKAVNSDTFKTTSSNVDYKISYKLIAPY